MAVFGKSVGCEIVGFGSMPRDYASKDPLVYRIRNQESLTAGDRSSLVVFLRLVVKRTLRGLSSFQACGRG